MPIVEVLVPDNVIAVNGLGLHFNDGFPHEDNLECLIWEGSAENGSGFLKFTDDYDMMLLPPLYNEEVAPYIAIWQGEKARQDKQRIEQEAEINRHMNSPEFRLHQLRNLCVEKMTAYDNATHQLDRLYRLAQTDEQKQKIDALQREWDKYAEALCHLTDNPDSPWDGGLSTGTPQSVPWPKEPPRPKTLNQ